MGGYPERGENEVRTMTIQNKVDETIGALCDRIEEKVKENSVCTDDLVALVSALAELTSARAKLKVTL